MKTTHKAPGSGGGGQLPPCPHLVAAPDCIKLETAVLLKCSVTMLFDIAVIFFVRQDFLDSQYTHTLHETHNQNQNGIFWK